MAHGRESFLDPKAGFLPRETTGRKPEVEMNKYGMFCGGGMGPSPRLKGVGKQFKKGKCARYSEPSRSLAIKDFKLESGK